MAFAGKARNGRAGDIRAGRASSLERAKTYPYNIPQSCYVLAGGRTLPLVGVDLSSALACEVLDEGTVHSLRAWARGQGMEMDSDDTPELLLAYGSNASVDGLSRKLADCLHASAIPVARATLADFDVVYSAHLSSYGAIPATLQHSPGARTTVFVLVTSPAQCRTLRATEPNYDFVTLDGVELRLVLGPTLPNVSAVISRHGALRLDGTEVGVAAVRTRNRRFPSLTQAQMMRAVRDLVAPGAHLDDFILENIQNADLARERTAALERTARPFAYRSWEIIEEEHSTLLAGKQ